MTVGIQQGVIILDGPCPSGDADNLLQLLLSDPDAYVDWRTCEAAHTAVVQVLLAAGRPVLGPPRGVALAPIAGALPRGREKVLASRARPEMRNSE